MVDQRAVGRDAPHLAQPFDGVRQRELLARHAGHEPAAADLAARLEPPVDARELAPRRGVGLAGEQPPEHDAVAAQQRPRLELDRLVARHAVAAGRDRRPPAGEVAAAIVLGRASARRPHQRAQSGESVRRRQPAGDQRADRLPQLVGVEPAGRREVAEERRATRPQHRQHAPRRRRRAAAPPPAVRSARHASACSRRNSAIGVAGTRLGAGLARPLRRREARPAGLARQADHVEHRRLVAIEPRRQHRALPRAGRQLVAVERGDDLPQPVEARSACDDVSTCCQRNRKRMKSAGLTGSISARSRFSV